jgi:hypothetical protein
VTGGHAGYCGSCGYSFVAKDPVRAMVKPKTEHGVAILVGIAVAALNYILFA